MERNKTVFCYILSLWVLAIVIGGLFHNCLMCHQVKCSVRVYLGTSGYEHRAEDNLKWMRLLTLEHWN
jgi:hypothetical protein